DKRSLVANQQRHRFFKVIVVPGYWFPSRHERSLAFRHRALPCRSKYGQNKTLPDFFQAGMLIGTVCGEMDFLTIHFSTTSEPAVVGPRYLVFESPIPLWSARVSAPCRSGLRAG